MVKIKKLIKTQEERGSAYSQVLKKVVDDRVAIAKENIEKGKLQKELSRLSENDFIKIPLSLVDFKNAGLMFKKIQYGKDDYAIIKSYHELLKNYNLNNFSISGNFMYLFFQIKSES